MLTLGQVEKLKGDVTRLASVAGRSPRRLEGVLGYGPGRLDKGYWIALLREPLRKAETKFSGLTLRAGGREGLPLGDPIADGERMHNHTQLLDKYGPMAVDRMLDELVGNPLTLTGDKRIIKVVPVTRHVGANPAQEYPMGEGAPQFTLTDSHMFFVAVFVDERATATTAAGWSVSVADGAIRQPRQIDPLSLAGMTDAGQNP